MQQCIEQWIRPAAVYTDETYFFQQPRSPSAQKKFVKHHMQICKSYQHPQVYEKFVGLQCPNSEAVEHAFICLASHLQSVQGESSTIQIQDVYNIVGSPGVSNRAGGCESLRKAIPHPQYVVYVIVLK